MILLFLSVKSLDKFSTAAVIILSFLSSLTGVTNYSVLELPSRITFEPNTMEEVAIRTHEGSFLVARCNLSLANELYFSHKPLRRLIATDRMHCMMCLLGNLMLAFGIVCLANATARLQIVWFSVYLLLHLVTWAAAQLPDRYYWDTTCYKVTAIPLSERRPQKRNLLPELPDIFLQDTGKISQKSGYNGATYTQALWEAIAITQNIRWVELSNACPSTNAWYTWLAIAERMSSGATLVDGYGASRTKIWMVPHWEWRTCLQELLSNSKHEDSETDIRDVIERYTKEKLAAFQNEGAFTSGLSPRSDLTTIASRRRKGGRRVAPERYFDKRTSLYPTDYTDEIRLPPDRDEEKRDPIQAGADAPLLPAFENDGRERSLQRMTSRLLRKMLRPRVPEGYRRLEWTCVSYRPPYLRCDDTYRARNNAPRNCMVIMRMKILLLWMT